MNLPTITSDPAVMRLAHPIRFGAAQPGATALLRACLGPKTFHALCRALGDDGSLTATAVDSVANLPDHAHLRHYLALLDTVPGGTELGNEFAFLMALRHQLRPAPYFRIDDALVRLLEQTDIADDVPIDCLRTPYPRIYVELGASRSISLFVPNMISGRHVLEGAYVEMGPHPTFGLVAYVMLTGSPLGKTHALDDATHSVLLPLNNEEMPLCDALRWSFERSAEMARAHGLRESPAAYYQASFDCLQFLAKALLYINLPEARRAAHPERSSYLQKHADLKSAAKRAKVERKARLLVDHILVTAPPAPTEASSHDSAGRTLRAHWRRGHYRMQPYGAQRLRRRLQWIRRTLVGGGSEAAAPTPDYVVR